MRTHTLQLLLAALLFSFPAAAGPVTWAVINAAFDDGGTISGSFTYNADTQVFSSIALTSTDGSTRSGANYVLPTPCCGLAFPNAGFLIFVTNAPGDLTGTPVFAAELTSAMTNAGGTIPFALGPSNYHEEAACVDATCSDDTSPYRYLTSGAVAAVPEPGGLLLLSPLAIGVLWRRFRR